MNDNVDKEPSTLKYVGVEDAREKVRRNACKGGHQENIPCPPRGQVAAGDDVGRQAVRGHMSAVWPLLGTKVFMAVVDAVEWTARSQGMRFMILYDDFLLTGAPKSPECRKALRCLLELLAQQGMPEQAQGPCGTAGIQGRHLNNGCPSPSGKAVKSTQLLTTWRGRGL